MHLVGFQAVYKEIIYSNKTVRAVRSPRLTIKHPYTYVSRICVARFGSTSLHRDYPPASTISRELKLSTIQTTAADIHHHITPCREIWVTAILDHRNIVLFFIAYHSQQWFLDFCYPFAHIDMHVYVSPCQNCRVYDTPLEY